MKLAGYRLTLRVQPQTRLALPISGDAVVGDETRKGPGVIVS